MKLRQLSFLLLSNIIAALMLFSCGSQHRVTGFDLQSSLREFSNDTSKPIYLRGTMPIDSADVDKIIFDVWRLEAEDYPKEIRLFTRVFDSTGMFITNMADPYRKDKSITYFTSLTEFLGVIYNRREAPIDSFTVREFGANDSIPYNIVLSVDYSGSMSAVMDAIYEGTELFVGMKFPYDQIALTSFNKYFDVKVPFNSDTGKILKLYRAKRQQNYGQFSGMYDALMSGMAMFKGTDPNVPRVLVVFTDGDDNYSKSGLSSVIDTAMANKIHLFTVAFGYSKDDNLRQLAKYSGGKFYKAYSKEDLIAIFRDIYMSLRYYYLVSYKPPKFWGHHDTYPKINLPGRTDTLVGHGEYDMTGSGPWDVGDVFERPILFDFDKDSVKAESYYIIDEIVDVMMSMPNLKLEIQGHTDNVGTIDYNQNLSERRARSVYVEIVRRGIEPNRLRFRGFGMSRPKVNNDTEQNRAINRRTEFHILAR